MSRTTPSHPARPSAHRSRVVAAAVVAGVLLALVLPAAAASAAAYRYWGYFTLSSGTWQFATEGQDQTKPADGSIEGWRFAVGDEGDTRMPRATPSFEDLCAATEASAGKKRVGVVIDYGRTADTADGTEPPAAKGECALVDETATGSQVLAAVASVRSDKGLVCAVDQFPDTGCGDPVKTVTAEAKAADTPVELVLPSTEKASDTAAASSPTSEDSSSARTGTLIAVVVVVLLALGIAVLLLVRRRRTA